MNKQNLKNWAEDVQKIFEELNIPNETKIVLADLMEKMTVEQVDEMVRTMYHRLIEQKVEKKILTEDRDYQVEKEKIDNNSLREINNILNI